MWQWTTAVVTASLLGSGHCVGMCGPFAVLATGTPSSTQSWAIRATSLASYHLGRLTTYLFLGAVLGGLGSVADGLAISAGLAPLAARCVGALMVIMGILLLRRWWRGSSGVVQHTGWATRWNRTLLGIRKRLPARTAAGTAFSWGLISTWLPCGWLYVFAIAAAGAGGAAWGMTLMAAFWIGTLPLLSLVPLGAWWLSGKRPAPDKDPIASASDREPVGWNSRLRAFATSVHPFVKPAAACLLIAFGILTATHRAEIALGSLKTTSASSSQSPAHVQLQEVIDQPLPCCEPGANTLGAEGSEHGNGK